MKFRVETTVAQEVEADSPAEAFLRAMTALAQVEGVQVNAQVCWDDDGTPYDEVSVFEQCLAWAQGRAAK